MMRWVVPRHIRASAPLARPVRFSDAYSHRTIGQNKIATPRRTLYGLARDVSVTETCPAAPAGCSCEEIPDNLDIDRTTKLEGSIPRYDLHIVVQSAAPADKWPSRFEDEPSLATTIKRVLGKGGALHNPSFSTLVTACYTGPVSTEPAIRDRRSVWVFPTFRTASAHPDAGPACRDDASPESVAAFLENHVLPSRYWTSTGRSPPAAHRPADDDPDLNRPAVFVCGHDQRDDRCGKTGPPLARAFARALAEYHLASTGLDTADENAGAPLVGLVSHVGGHKFAGNAAIYVPPAYQKPPHSSALAGVGVWYGRVAPAHVPGLVAETVGHGRAVAELFRGAVGPALQDSKRE